MADAKYVVGDHRNGDAKIELDANKRQYSGLTKEELLKYADDPFWVRLRWFMFVLFWALWLSMLVGAIAIIIRAPKCSPPPPKKWFEKGPIVDLTPIDTLVEVEALLPLLKSNKVQGAFVDAVPTYEVLEKPELAVPIKQFVENAKSYGVKIIVDLIPNFVFNTSSWFQLSANRSAEYEDYFIWKKPTEYDSAGNAKPPNSWVSTLNEPAWTLHPERKEFYLHQYGAHQPDLNFRNAAVKKHFDDVLQTYVNAGVDGVRLVNARQVLVNSSLHEEEKETSHSSLGATHDSYAFWRHQHTRDQPELDQLLAHWAAIVNPDATVERVFTLHEPSRPELFLLRAGAALAPPSAAPVRLRPRAAPAAALLINKYLNATWNALQLKADAKVELAEFALLLPAAPVIDLTQLDEEDNTTTTGHLSHLVPLREDASIQHGHSTVVAVNSTTGVKLLAVARWKPGHTGYMAVLNPSEEAAEANVALASVPPTLTVHHITAGAAAANYTNHMSVSREQLLVPAQSTVVLSYVPEAPAQ
ncbi:amino acid transporter heavy chain SLC3A1 isoform X2 [Plodia interpunctella]|nr:neutral and basic amino acid transport protein rBAT isoform X2 [Plodia interpunctella]